MQHHSSKDRCVRILYLEDDPRDAELFDWKLQELDRPYSISRAASEDQFKAVFEKGEFDLIISDSGLLGYGVLRILDYVHQRRPQIPFIIFSGNASPQLKQTALEHGAANVVSKDDFPQLMETIRRISPRTG